MAREYQVDPAYGWLEQAYAAIGEREESISQSEGERLGLDAVVRLANLRERIRKTRFEQEMNTLLQNVHASPRPSPVVSARPSPPSLHGGLALSEEDAAPPFSPARSIEWLPRSPPVRDAELYALQDPANELGVPSRNTLTSPLNVSVPPDFLFGTCSSSTIPVAVVAPIDAVYDSELVLEKGKSKKKKGKKK